MIKNQKENSVKLVKDILSNNDMLVLLDYKGLNAGNASRLRTELKDKKANFRVFKNTLFRKAIEDTKFDFLRQFLFEQVGLSYSKDPISLSNVIHSLIRDNVGLRIKGVSLNGTNKDIFIVEEMAGLGSFEDIRARFIGTLNAAGSKLVGVLEAYADKLKD
ncbi:MAG: 50S ribosomal protein L10 [Rickettsiales bacterium]|jgi:large subunit ribosomal protein L10|nr:50S ribosomal protein L10 [Rickettsiales bacterium]